MARARHIIQVLLIAFVFSGLAVRITAQDSAQSLTNSGQISINGQSHSYVIRHLPVNAFPQLPPAIQAELNRRGCLIPQTNRAHGPENVVHGSLESPGSSDWAILCSVHGSVSLLVFSGDTSSDPSTLMSVSETDRLQLQPVVGTLGFDWAIDIASPETIHEAQLGMKHPLPRLDHDALADTIIDRKTIFRIYTGNQWMTLDTQD